MQPPWLAQVGNGGAVNITTATASEGTTPVTASIGQVTITGAVDDRGGQATNTQGGKGGNGGTFSDSSATLTVAASTAGGASINVTAGTGKTGSGTAGAMTISTFGIEQSIPADFNLTGTTNDTAALPGALFTVGSAAVNGTAGNIVNGTTVISSTNGALITSANAINQGGIRITPAGGSYSIVLNGQTISIGPRLHLALRPLARISHQEKRWHSIKFLAVIHKPSG